ncbi:unannotated protein [freshwater metagenome]|uniref:Unannotated protein n=1 Tax=freshwater metagenome TaxID=449393 RepID=A0A6J6U3R0_9ZZZZ
MTKSGLFLFIASNLISLKDSHFFIAAVIKKGHPDPLATTKDPPSSKTASATPVEAAFAFESPYRYTKNEDFPTLDAHFVSKLFWYSPQFS